MAPNRSTYTTTSLKRWSCKGKDIPAVLSIKSLHVYDFDNTLFQSPLPNPQLWTYDTIGKLQTYETFASGGWWHDPSILSATGDGADIEERRGWEGWWTDAVFRLAELSIQQKDVLTILLTGRAETTFADLINRILDSKKLDFDLVCLKPEVGPEEQRFDTTMDFKQEFLRQLVFTYKDADEIRVYEDRPNHVKRFREYFEKLNKSLLSHPMGQPPPPRKPITAEVVAVCEAPACLNSTVEAELVQRIINRHNETISSGGPNMTRAKPVRFHIKENFVYCGYMISPNDSVRLIALTNIQPTVLIDSGEVKLLAASILITPYRPTKQILDKVGGKGKKVTWQVTGLGQFENRVWAARVAPVSESQQGIYTQDATPLVVLALKKGARPVDASRIQNWQPVPAAQGLIFETVVGDKVMLKIEEINDNDGYGSRSNNRHQQGTKRRYKSNSPDWRGKENYQSQKKLETEQDREEGSWVPRNAQVNNNGNGDRHGQAKYFNQGKGGQNEGRNFSGNRGGNRGGNRKHDQQQNNNGGQGRSNDRSRGGGAGKNRGSRGGPPYKSLDGYGPGGFDGPGDSRSGGPGGVEMVMNY